VTRSDAATVMVVVAHICSCPYATARPQRANAARSLAPTYALGRLLAKSAKLSSPWTCEQGPRARSPKGGQRAADRRSKRQGPGCVASLNECRKLVHHRVAWRCPAPQKVGLDLDAPRRVRRGSSHRMASGKSPPSAHHLRHLARLQTWKPRYRSGMGPFSSPKLVGVPPRRFDALCARPQHQVDRLLPRKSAPCRLQNPWSM